MKINCINFGARISESTFLFLKEARSKGLDTEKMENLIKKSFPNKVIYTHLVDNTLDGEENKGIRTMEIASPYISIPLLKLKVKTNGSTCFIGEAYKINQDTINIISKKLEKISEQHNDSIDINSDSIDKILVNKLGEPIFD